ncbi:MAG: PTS sugar transporter subunit IIA [Breznakia sp.]
MKDLLQEKNVQIVDSVKDWVEAIHIAVSPLVSEGYVERRYIDGIIENTYQFGPYYVLCENLALLHARPEQGVISRQVAITLLRNPIKFKEDGCDVCLLLTLAASDSQSHLEVMKAIATIFSDSNRVQQLIHAKSSTDIYKQFMEAGEHA